LAVIALIAELVSPKLEVHGLETGNLATTLFQRISPHEAR